MEAFLEVPHGFLIGLIYSLFSNWFWNKTVALIT